MNPLKNWHTKHQHTYNTGAAAIGVSRRAYARYLKLDVLPKWLELIVFALENKDV